MSNSYNFLLKLIDVAPFAGAWIEIPGVLSINHGHKTSLPSRERGLKYVKHVIVSSDIEVAPFAGAWIEIHF